MDMGKRLFVIFCLSLVAGCLSLADKAEAKVLLPNDPGDYSLWLNDGGGVGTYDKVKEYPNNDGEVGYNTISLNDTKQSYNFEDASGITGAIRGVRVVFYAKVNGVDIEYIRPFLRISGTDYFGDNCTTINNSSYTQCSYYWLLNPYNSSTWSVPDLTNLQAGFETQANGAWNSDEHKVTQLYVDVDFESETKKTKYYIAQKLVAVDGASDDPFSFFIADPVDAVQSAFLEIGGVAQPVANVNLEVKVDDSASTPAPGTYDKTYAINASGRPTNFKVVHDVTDYFKQFVNSAGTYDRYLHLKTDNNIYLLHAKLVITYTYIVPPAAVGAYQIKAELASVVFDTGVIDGAAYNSIMWKGIYPGATKVRFQLATSNDSGGPWNFIGGASCNNSSWYETVDQNKPVEISCAPSYHNNHRYFKYKVQICSNDCEIGGNNTPEVQDIVISYSP